MSQEAQKTDGMGVRMGTLETSIISTSEAARGARERADAAMAKAEGVDGRLTKLWSNRYNAKLVETVNVQFGFNRSELDDGAQTTLLGLVKEMQAIRATVELAGYTDMKGDREYNYTLSQRRVESVRRFLVEKGVQIGRIPGRGARGPQRPGDARGAEAPGGGEADDRPGLGTIRGRLRPGLPQGGKYQGPLPEILGSGPWLCRLLASPPLPRRGWRGWTRRWWRRWRGGCRRRCGSRGIRRRRGGGGGEGAAVPGPTRRPLRGRRNLVALGVHALRIGPVS